MPNTPPLVCQASREKKRLSRPAGVCSVGGALWPRTRYRHSATGGGRLRPWRKTLLAEGRWASVGALRGKGLTSPPSPPLSGRPLSRPSPYYRVSPAAPWDDLPLSPPPQPFLSPSLSLLPSASPLQQSRVASKGRLRPPSYSRSRPPVLCCGRPGVAWPPPASLPLGPFWGCEAVPSNQRPNSPGRCRVGASLLPLPCGHARPGLRSAGVPERSGGAREGEPCSAAGVFSRHSSSPPDTLGCGGGDDAGGGDPWCFGVSGWEPWGSAWLAASAGAVAGWGRRPARLRPDTDFSSIILDLYSVSLLNELNWFKIMLNSPWWFLKREVIHKK